MTRITTATHKLHANSNLARIAADLGDGIEVAVTCLNDKFGLRAGVVTCAGPLELVQLL